MTLLSYSAYGMMVKCAAAGLLVGILMGAMIGIQLAMEVAQRRRKEQERKQKSRERHQEEHGFNKSSLLFENDHLHEMFW